jgi:undecaprenyl pyrophosphate phosphatase UppP
MSHLRSPEFLPFLVVMHFGTAVARFTFLLATPIIAGATVLEAPKVLHSGAALHAASIVAGVVAAVTAYASIAFLMRYFRKHEFDALDPFDLLLRPGRNPDARLAVAALRFRQRRARATNRR